MEKASQIFKQTRLRKRISLKAATEKTRIPRRYLKAIETDDCAVFPGFNYAQLYVRDYAGFLGLLPEKMVGLFRRDWQGECKSRKTIVKSKKRITGIKIPLITGSGLLVGLVILLAVIYLVRQYLLFNSPPPLKASFSCLSGKVIVEGKTNREAAVRVEDKSAFVDSKGNFKQEIAFPWPAQVVVTSESPAGKIRQKILKVECD